MSDEWRSTLLHFGSSLASIIVLLAVIRARRIPLQGFLALKWAGGRIVLMWIALFVLLVVVEEFASKALGLPEPQPWDWRYSGIVLALRVVGIVLLAPAAEELVFRGALYTRISETRLRSTGAILLPALLFACSMYSTGRRK